MKRRGQGFTLIELIVVLVIAGAVILLIASAFSGCSNGSGGSAASGTSGSVKSLPDSFYIDQRVIALTTTLDVGSGKNSYGTVSETLVSLTTKFTYTDGTGMVVATANMRLVSWGTKIDVYDGSGNLLATIQEHVVESLFKTWTTYSIVDASGSKIAESKKVDFLVTNFTLKTPAGSQVASLDRPAINITGDRWTVSASPASPVDKRILVMLAAYKTTADDSK